ncbi:MAG: hypothetical protein WCH58_02485 [Candidatus Saccharibacteria bacterium]
MNTKKKVIILVSLLIIVSSVIFGINYYNNKLLVKDVIINSTYPNTNIKLKLNNGHETEYKITNNSSSIKLQVGNYTAFYINNELSQNSFSLSITKDTSKIDLDPFDNSNQLNNILANENTSITNTINSLYKSNNYVISDKKVYHQGEWFSCSLVVYQINPFSGSGFSDPDNYDTYFIVLKKDTVNNKWGLVGGPSLILTKTGNPSIPNYILDNLNPTK